MAGLLRRLASFSRLISFDKRGFGCSDPVPFGELTAVDEWMDDIGTVMDAAGSQRASLVATNESGPAAILFAASHPRRVAALVLINTLARFTAAHDYPWGMPARAHETLLAGVEDDWETMATFNRVVPSIATNEGMRRWWGVARRLQASPATATALFKAFAHLDARAALPLIQCPTLVLHQIGAYVVRVDNGRYLAEHIPDAAYIELPGNDTLWWGDGGDAFVDEVEGFLTGVRRGPESDRVLATVVFTDLVGSTERAASLGDRRWRSLLNEYDALANRLLLGFNGRHIKSTGDGTLATFDGPTRAVRFALAMRDSVRDLGVELRCGVHTGEVERRGEDVGGLAVHLAARVQTLASPGEVLVSRTVTDLVVGSGIAFDDRGEHQLKGVPGGWRLYAVDS